MNVQGLVKVFAVTFLCVLLAIFIPFLLFHKKDPVSWMIPIIEFFLYLYFQLKRKKYICYVGKTKIENTSTSWIWILFIMTCVSILTVSLFSF